MQTITTLGGIIGGIGLFLLAINLITDGLKVAAGSALNDLLRRSTATRLRGITSGMLITAVVQSSGAVTVATIGFVNAGLLSLTQALGVVYGANIGTTMTGWLVAAVGFKIKMEVFALPMIGIGMILRLTGLHSRRGALGMALVGFGLFFIGLDVLRTAFEGVAAAFDVGQYSSDGIAGVLLFLWLGFIMTVLTQSSSVAIAIILTAATGEVLALNAAAAMVIGANVGTTTMAAMAVIGATPNAKRVAAAHIVFNVVTALAALAMLPLLLAVVEYAGEVAGLAQVPAVILALFHTVFNVLGVMLLWPFTGALSRALEKRFRTHEEIEGRPRYLDSTVAVTSTLALNALYLELGHIDEIVRRMAKGALSAEMAPGQRLNSDHQAVDQLIRAVGDFITGVQRGILTTEHSEKLAEVLRITGYLIIAADLVVMIAQRQAQLGEITDAHSQEELSHYKADSVSVIGGGDLAPCVVGAGSLEACLNELDSRYRKVKNQLLRASAEGRIRVGITANYLEHLSNIRRMMTQLAKTRFSMHHLCTSASLDECAKSVGEEPALRTAGAEGGKTEKV